MDTGPDSAKHGPIDLAFPFRVIAGTLFSIIVVLTHGLTDSPHYVSAIGRRFFSEGVHVVDGEGGNAVANEHFIDAPELWHGEAMPRRQGRYKVRMEHDWQRHRR